MALTDTACKKATCPEGKTRHRLTDGSGLYLEIGASGSKRWFWKFYRTDGKESRLALGSYPEVTLKEARDARDDARKIHRSGKNPVLQRKQDRQAQATKVENTFEAVAREFHILKSPEWSEAHARRWLERLAKDVFPYLGSLALTDITAAVLLQTLRRVEARGVRETVHSIHQACGQVFNYGVATSRCVFNPAAGLSKALPRVMVKNMAAVLDTKQAGELLRAVVGYQGHPTTRAALALSALLFQRPGNMRAMEWAELDVASATWTIPAAKMKLLRTDKANGRPHIVPLSTQAVALLEDLAPLTGHGKYVFPSMLTGERCMSENTLNAALRRMGFDKDTATAHGFRAMARTLMVEKLDINPEVIEAQLAHGKSGPLGSAYDRAEFMAQRRQMMQTWADYLDQLRQGNDRQPALAT